MPNLTPVRRGLTVLIVAGLLAAIALGILQATSRPSARDGRDYDLNAALAALSGAPPPLKALYRQAARVVPGEPEEFDRRLRSLRGFPVVINVWASWCGPCRDEFPILQRATSRWGTRVAFLGLATRDTRSGAEAFLAEMPVPYPTLLEPTDGPLLKRLRVPPGAVPVTVLLGRTGKTEFIRSGAYASDEQLNTDIERYLRP